MTSNHKKFLCWMFAVIVIFSICPRGVFGSEYDQRINELNSKISNQNEEIKKLEQEIDALEGNISAAVGKKQTLNGEIGQLDATKKKLDAQLKVTTKKINLAALNITELEGEIGNKKDSIDTVRLGIADSIKDIRDVDNQTDVERILSDSMISDFWKEIDAMSAIQEQLDIRVADLRAAKLSLEDNRNKLDREKKKQESLKSQLSDQKQIAAQNITAKNKLLTTTKNLESNYRKMLSAAEAKKTAVENELNSYESQLKAVIDLSKLPTSGTGALSWPTVKPYVTQYFGDTAFSRTQPIYNGKGHNGIDLRASVGTPIMSAASGVVAGTGDTDPVCQGASYGKWVMIRHSNGLSTIYGHLSLVKVSAGQNVAAGTIIAYSGMTGYALGPHLHFSVVASQGVNIDKLKSKVKGCGTYTIPLAPFNAYLNPMLYLPII